jgi:hypothetical protein
MTAGALLVSVLLAQGGSTAAQFTPERMQGLADEISASVETLRRLKFKNKVKAVLVTPAQARETFRAKIQPWEAEQVQFTQKAYVQLGLIPAKTDLLTNYLNMAEKDVLGYYDPATKMLYVLGHVPEDEVRPVIAHELTHALEDQHFDFQALGKKRSGDDEAIALSAVIEGSAMVVMVHYMARQRDAEASKKAGAAETKRAQRLKSAPSFVQQSVILPYILGFTFLLKGMPWMFENGMPNADIDEAYANPPHSTRHILHPEQYWWGAWRKEPPPVALPDLSKTLGPGWSRAAVGSIGELGLAVLTGSHLDLTQMDSLLPSRWTNDSAIGTSGDLYHHYVNGEKSLTVLLTRWETLRDAEQFDKALLSRGKYFLRYGVHVLVLAGEVDPALGPALATAAMQGISYWPK